MKEKGKKTNTSQTVNKTFMASITLDKIKKIYRHYAEIPVPKKAYLCKKSKDVFGLKVYWTHQDVDLSEPVSYCKFYSLQVDQFTSVVEVKSASELMNTSNELASLVSRNENRKVIIKELSKDSDPKKVNQIMEIWNEKIKLKSINIDNDKIHGKVLLFANYSCLEWSPNETSLLYLSETLVPSQGFFSVDSLDNEKTKKKEFGNEYLFKEEWGEQLEGWSHSSVCVLNTLNGAFKPKVIEKPGITFAEPFWITENKIGFIGWKEEPRRLGLIFCPIRRNYLYTVDITTPDFKPEIIYGQDQEVAITSPRLSPDGKSLVFLVRSVGGPHFKRAKLVILNLESRKEIVFLDSNEPNNLKNPSTFSSLYTQSLPSKCWITNEKLILTCIIGTSSYIYLIDTNSESVQKIYSPYKSVDILDYFENILVISCSDPCVSTNVFVAKFDENCVKNLYYSEIEPNWTVRHEDLTFNCDEIAIKDENGKEQWLTSILISPKNMLNKPGLVILIPHGGPHSATIANFSKLPLIFAKLGFKIILTNYRGSIGISEDYTISLCGKVGTNDVEDVLSCLQYYQSQNEVDKNNIFLIGGSHGGFLVTSLIAKNDLDFKFKACVAINPVVDIALNVGVTDIPDWCWTEAVGLSPSYNYNLLPNGKDLTTMLTKSPIFKVDKITTPTLLLLGSKDKRVPYFQGLNFYRALKARNIETKCFVYEDNHSLAKIAHDIDATINMLIWILQFVNK